ncbi:acetylglucosaminyltransferase [Croceivirga lutea]|uniref:glycosyltransferase family 2 protein n=1 Tax=Croceivirga lutea TaxID=1775167 RepID=UPI00163AF92A|nr:glycosyltransferase [Croceivirga lutea]GGG42475.1 acetylglucosaminyltransferase [Croceivirga lutea]
MKTLAVLLTCFNRKEKTLSALSKVYKASAKVESELTISVYLTDDGSTDGTADAVRKTFPKVIILKGTGDLFWAGGMKMSWRAAKKQNFDAYLLLNDDTDIVEELFKEYLKADEYCQTTYTTGGVYLGATQDPDTKKLTYGGAKLTNKWTFKYNLLEPNNSYQNCELGNANIMFVSNEVVEQIGILSEGYKHGVADYDYTLKAVKKKIPVLLMPTYLGFCKNDHSNIYDKFTNSSFKQRLAILKNPLGLDFSSNLNLMKRHFPLRVPMVVFSSLLKLIFPQLYINLSKNR